MHYNRIITYWTNECTRFYWSHNISTHQLLHDSGLNVPSSGNTQLLKTVAGAACVLGSTVVSYWKTVVGAACVLGSTVLRYWKTVVGAACVLGSTVLRYCKTVVGSACVLGSTVLRYCKTVVGAACVLDSKVRYRVTQNTICSNYCCQCTTRCTTWILHSEE